MRPDSHPNLHPRTARLALISLFALALAGPPLKAQITFPASQLPSVVGRFALEYIAPNVDPSAVIGPTGGPQVWDFSQAPGTNEYVRHLDIVAPADSGDPGDFSNATYAERYSDPVSNFQEWDFYSLGSAGRTFYGSINLAAGTNVFSPAAVDIPAVVEYGSQWSNTTGVNFSFYTQLDASTAIVDAYGAVVLPGIGAVPALRVNVLLQSIESIDGLPLSTSYVREYYWLAPGIGKAVDILSVDASTAPPAIFASAAEVRRVFQVGPALQTARLATGLHLQVLNGLALLDWSSATNASAYQVQAIADLTSTNWAVTGSSSSNSFSEAASAPQQFYRVLVEP